MGNQRLAAKTGSWSDFRCRGPSIVKMNWQVACHGRNRVRTHAANRPGAFLCWLSFGSSNESHPAACRAGELRVLYSEW